MKDSSEVRDLSVDTVDPRAHPPGFRRQPSTSPFLELSVLAVVAGLLLFVVRDSWFFGDDWAFLGLRLEQWQEGDYVGTLLRPHNEHLVLLPVGVYLILSSTFGISSAIPYLVLVIAGHLVVLWGLRTILIRVGVPLWGRLVALIWFGLFGAGAENLVWPFQMGFIWAFAFSLWGLIIVSDRSNVSLRRDLLASGLFLAGLLTGSTALSVTVVAAVVLLVTSRSSTRAIRIFLVPGLVYVSWYVIFELPNRGARFPFELTQVVPYLTAGLSSGLNATLQFPTLGLVLGVAAYLAIASLDWFEGRRFITAALASIVFLFFLLGAISRASLGPDQAASSRYVYFVGATVIPALVLVLVEVVRRRPPTLALLGVLVAIAIVGNAIALLSFRNERRNLTDAIRQQADVASLYASQPYTDDGALPDPVYSPQLSVGALRDFQEDGLWIVDTRLTAQALVDGALGLGWRQIGGDEPVGGLGQDLEVRVIRDVAVVRAGECLVLTATGESPEVEFSGTPGSMQFESNGSAASLRFRSTADPTVESGPADLQSILRSGPQWLGVFPIDATAVVSLPVDFPTTLCGVRAPSL